MRILNVKHDAVTRGVLDKDVAAFTDLIEITFVDDQNTAHTIFVHKDGPFTDPADAVAAFLDGTVHDQPDAPTVPDEPPPPQGLAEAGNFPVGV